MYFIWVQYIWYLNDKCIKSTPLSQYWLDIFPSQASLLVTHLPSLPFLRGPHRSCQPHILRHSLHKLIQFIYRYNMHGGDHWLIWSGLTSHVYIICLQTLFVYNPLYIRLMFSMRMLQQQNRQHINNNKFHNHMSLSFLQCESATHLGNNDLWGACLFIYLFLHFIITVRWSRN